MELLYNDEWMFLPDTFGYQIKSPVSGIDYPFLSGWSVEVP